MNSINSIIKNKAMWLVLVALFAITANAAEGTHKRTIDIDSSVVTEHDTKILGKRVKYSATTGTQPVWNSKDDAVATLFYT
ncbi:MAG: carboxypeptidase, partial [Alteromonas sp.]